MCADIWSDEDGICRTYWCYSHLIDKEVGETSGLADESLLT